MNSYLVTVVNMNMNEIKLSDEQEQIIELFKKGENMFITGPAGTGKTFIIKKMVEIANEQNKKIQVCALTGCAAVLLKCKAKTLHSWAGIGLATGDTNRIVDRICNNKYKSKAWKSVDILIIDEVSMMSKKLFDVIENIARVVRKQTHVPFGGIQVILSGDFYQLPPVGTLEDIDTTLFCFESLRWRETMKNIIILKKIFRQEDQRFAKILNQIRTGRLSLKSYNTLNERVSLKYNGDQVIRPTILLPTRKQVNKINQDELQKLTTDKKVFKLSSVNEIDTSKHKFTQQQIDNEIQFLTNSIIAETSLVLCVGAQVMCVSNLELECDSPIVNGSQGIVEAFIDNLPLVRFINGRKKVIGYHIWQSETIPGIGVKQIPLIHAWAITIHKSQGLTLDIAEIDAGHDIFECGQTYVALSRVKCLNGLFLSAFEPTKITFNKKVRDFYTTF
jgi:ATP-dependent DNA helicase PIF1